MRNASTCRGFRSAFTLIELLVVMAVIGVLIGILLSALRGVREAARQTGCLSNQRQIGTSARLYMDDNKGQMFHHHEGWVLDDGSQVDQLPRDPEACAGGGLGNSQAEKPWAIFFQPYLGSRQVCFCPSDKTPRSIKLAANLQEYNGAITDSSQSLPPESEQAIAEDQGLNIQSYLLNSVFTHKSARYACERALRGFATDAVASTMANQNLIMFSERNSEAMNDLENSEFGSVSQDDYDSWLGEAAMVRWGEGKFARDGWIKYNRHGGAANYVYQDGHAAIKRWPDARSDQFPDRVVRKPLDDPPQ